MMPADAGTSQAGRMSIGWITEVHTQVPKIRVDQPGSLPRTS